jgi:excisionase family DNA binding protein
MRDSGYKIPSTRWSEGQRIVPESASGESPLEVQKSPGGVSKVLGGRREKDSKDENPTHSQKGSALQESAFERLLNLREAAELLGMHWKTLEGMARKNTVPAFRIGGRWRFRASVLNEWLEKRLVGPGSGEVQWTLPAALRESQEQE